MSKILTVYFSHKGENHIPDGIRVLEKGNTAYAAEHIQAAVGGDLFEIDTVVPYSANYKECVGQSVQDMKTQARPELKAYLEDVSQYDTVFVCFPCWCGTAPMCVYTFLDHYDWTGKKVLPLCTNEGSGLANAPRDIANACTGAVIGEGLSVKGHQVKDSEEIIAAWAKANI